jgi:hypothetical protein
MATAPGYFGTIKYVTNGSYAYCTWEYIEAGVPANGFFLFGNDDPANSGGLLTYPYYFTDPYIGGSDRSSPYIYSIPAPAYSNYLYVSASFSTYDGKNSPTVASNANATQVTNLAFLSNTTTSLTFRWDPPSVFSGAVTGYKVYYRANSVGGWIDGGSPSGAPHTITGLSIGTSYQVMVRAVTTTGESTFDDQYQATFTASTVAVTTPDAPGTPTAIRGAASGTVDLTWGAPGSNGGTPIDLYQVQVSTDGASWNAAFTTAALSGSATGLANGTAYTFRVLAHNSQGYGPASGSSSPYVVPGTVPSTPAAPAATVDDRKSTVSWVAPAANGYAITSYLVQYTDNGGVTQTAAGSVNSPSTSLLVTPLAQGISYEFRVAAVNGVGQSAWSAWSATVIPTGLPGAPTIVATQIDADSTNAVVKIEITPPAITGGFPIDNYRLEAAYSTDGGVTWGAWDLPEYPFVPDQTTPWYQVSEPFPVKTIKYRVAAITSNGTGPYSVESAPITTTLPPPPGSAPDAPTLLSVVPGDKQLVVTWDPPVNPGTGANVNSLTYTVQYSTDGGISWTTAP